MCYTTDWPLSTVSSLSIPYHTSGGGFAGGGRGPCDWTIGPLDKNAGDHTDSHRFFLNIICFQMLRTHFWSRIDALFLLGGYFGGPVLFSWNVQASHLCQVWAAILKTSRTSRTATRCCPWTLLDGRGVRYFLKLCGWGRKKSLLLL